jgi:oligosaccharide repeat unit polymerase
MDNEILIGTERGSFCVREIGIADSLSFWLATTGFFLGFFVLWSGQLHLVPFFLVIGYIAVLFAFLNAANAWRDIFNPLCSILAIGLIRFLIPGSLLLIGVEPPERVAVFYELMHLGDSDWLWGHALALAGLLGVILGWTLGPKHREKGKRLKFYLSFGIKYAAVAGMSVGFLALVTFVLANAGLGVLTSGEFRETTIHQGTGIFFSLAFLLIAGSLLLSCYLFVAGGRWTALAPVTVAMILYWPLGGRGRALTPLLGGLLFFWYFNRERAGWKKLSLKPTRVFQLLIAIVLMLWVLRVGQMYRGDFGARAFSESLSLSGLWSYVQGATFTDLGSLHSLAGAIAIGPGVLNGQTFFGNLTWPLKKFLPIPSRSAGVFIVEELKGFSDDEPRWGVHATLIGDAYLNFGLGGVAIVMMFFGSVLKILYIKFRGGALHVAIYAAAFLYSQQIFLASIEVWTNAVTVLAFTVVIILLGRTVFTIDPAGQTFSGSAVRH